MHSNEPLSHENQFLTNLPNLSEKLIVDVNVHHASPMQSTTNTI